MRILSVYNTCGIKVNRTDWYTRCIESLLAQSLATDVVISSCKNSDECLFDLKRRFGDDIKIVYYDDPYIVNVTFNKTVRSMDDGHDGHFFIDSGVDLTDPFAVEKAAERLPEFGMVALQIDNDTGYETIGFKQDSDKVQITGDDFVFPVGKAINLHAQIFEKSIFEKFGLIIPDVFAAYCTESTFPFLNASVNKRWCIVKDILCHHNKAVDGPSSSQPHWSPVHRNPWNNLLYGRNAMDFIFDREAIDAGLGYEECGGIMVHKEECYENGLCKDPDRLAMYVNKYFFSNKMELDYDRISIKVL